MALFCQNMLEIAAELTLSDPDYEDMALKFCEHFLWIASAMGHVGQDTGMWDEEDGFYYDVLRLPNGLSQRLKVRSMVGLLPLNAATVFDGELLAKSPDLADRLHWFLASRFELRAAIHDPMKKGVADRRLASILDETRLRRVLAKMLDENEFLSPYGLRSLSHFHVDHPYVIQAGGQEYCVSYLPAESDTGMFGGNSNWRGPIWIPVIPSLVLVRHCHTTSPNRNRPRPNEITLHFCFSAHSPSDKLTCALMAVTSSDGIAGIRNATHKIRGNKDLLPDAKRHSCAGRRRNQRRMNA